MYLSPQKWEVCHVILLYVDDLLVTSDDQNYINQVEKELKQTFKMIDLGNIKLY